MTSLHAQFPRIHHEPEAAARVAAADSYGAARLTMFISGNAYHVQPLHGEDAGIMKAFRLRKFDRTEYDIAQTADGVCCDCPDFTFRREAIDPSGCKHIKALVACGLIDPGLNECRATPEAPESGAERPAEVASHLVPVNGQSTTLLEIVEHEALGYRAWGTPAGRFLADQLGRIAQLLRWSGARTPDDHEDRMELYDRELRDRHYDQGYHDGLEAGRREGRPRG